MSQPNPEYTIKQHATGPALRVQLRDEETGLGVDISAMTIVAHMRDPLTGLAVFTDHVVAVDDAATGLIRLNWAAGDTDVAGTMLLEFEDSITKETFPQDGYVYVHVLTDLNGS